MPNHQGFSRVVKTRKLEKIEKALAEFLHSCGAAKFLHVQQLEEQISPSPFFTSCEPFEGSQEMSVQARPDAMAKAMIGLLEKAGNREMEWDIYKGQINDTKVLLCTPAL